MTESDKPIRMFFRKNAPVPPSGDDGFMERFAQAAGTLPDEVGDSMAVRRKAFEKARADAVRRMVLRTLLSAFVSSLAALLALAAVSASGLLALPGVPGSLLLALPAAVFLLSFSALSASASE